MTIIYNGKTLEKENPLISPFDFCVQHAQIVSQSGIVIQQKWLFWEEVYFNLMAAMRKMRIAIPMSFTMSFFEELITPHLSNNTTSYTITTYPKENKTQFVIRIQDWQSIKPAVNIDVYKDEKIFPTLSSGISCPQAIDSMASIYAKENQLDDVLLMNNKLKVARTIIGNVYYWLNESWHTNTSSHGAKIQAIDKHLANHLALQLNSFSSFELQKAEEVFVSSDEFGIVPIKNFRKKEYSIDKSSKIWDSLV